MYTPIDGDEALSATEPNVRAPKVQALVWEKLARGSPFLIVAELAFS